MIFEVKGIIRQANLLISRLNVEESLDDGTKPMYFIYKKVLTNQASKLFETIIIQK